MSKQAIARVASESGFQVAASYLGTPTSKSIETLAAVSNDLSFHAEWSTNEEVGFEIAAKATLVDCRGIKH